MTPAGRWFAVYVDPAPFDGEALTFDLATYHSAITRQMLQARLRKTPQAFGSDDAPLAANLAPDGRTLAVNAADLAAANAAVKARLAAGSGGAVDLLRRMASARGRLDRRARAVAAAIADGALPSRQGLIAYLDASATDQALGALKFCLPADLRPRLADWFGGDATLVEALLSPEGPSLWSRLSLQELGLAGLRLSGPAALYRRRLDQHRRAFGYVFAEDIEFREQETLSALDRRIAALGSGSRQGLARARHDLRAARRADQARKLAARERFALRLAQGAGGPEPATLVSHVMLARALTGHEDQNRQGKMRLLRDLRDLTQAAGLDLETAQLHEIATACPPFTARRPVLGSTCG